MLISLLRGWPQPIRSHPDFWLIRGQDFLSPRSPGEIFCVRSFREKKSKLTENLFYKTSRKPPKLRCSVTLVQVLWYPPAKRKERHASVDDSLACSSPESLSVSLSLEDTAHEELQGPAVQLRPGYLALARRLSVQPEHLPEVTK